MFLDNEQIKEVLPHRFPMLMIDTASELNPGISVVAEKHFDKNWDIYSGHFPSEPITPGVFLVEAMAQAADLILLSMPENSGKAPLFLGINRVRFLRPVFPDSTIVITAELNQAAEGGIYECTASVLLNGKKAASGLVTIALR